MTATSGPGISRMAEFSGLGYFAEIPGVIFDVQRSGPSTLAACARRTIAP
jgi:2-oxoglutarate ferredoxin oxidoreductase subunit alpha